MTTHESGGRRTTSSIVTSLGSLLNIRKPNASRKMISFSNSNEDNTTVNTDDTTQNSYCSQQEDEATAKEERRVGFHGRVKRRFIISREEISSEEIEAAWWTKKDYIDFQKNW